MNLKEIIIWVVTGGILFLLVYTAFFKKEDRSIPAESLEKFVALADSNATLRADNKTIMLMFMQEKHRGDSLQNVRIPAIKKNLANNTAHYLSQPPDKRVEEFLKIYGFNR